MTTQRGLFGSNHRPTTDKQRQTEYQSRIFQDGAPFVEDQTAPLLPMMQRPNLEELTIDGLQSKTFATREEAKRAIQFLDFRRHEIESARPVPHGDRWAILIS